MKLIQRNPDPCFPRARLWWAWFGELDTDSCILIGSPKTWFLRTCPVVKLHKQSWKLARLEEWIQKKLELAWRITLFLCTASRLTEFIYQSETARAERFLWFGFRMMKFRFRRQGNDPHREKIKQDLFAFNKVCGIYSVGSALSVSSMHAVSGCIEIDWNNITFKQMYSRMTYCERVLSHLLSLY